MLHVDQYPQLFANEIAFLSWPSQELDRQRMAADGRPRLLLVDPQVPPPEVDPLEDWVRVPADPVEIASRCLALLRRLGRPAAPTLDETGILRHDGRWVAIPDSQLPVLRLLLDALGQVVPFDRIVATCHSEGSTIRPGSVRTLVFRLGRRCADVGLALETVRARGVMLQIADVAGR